MSARESSDAGPLDLAADVRRCLAALAPISLDLHDDSARHAGHQGAGGGAHYRLQIVSPAFVGQPLLTRHRMVHAALADLMRSRIHALSIKAFTPEEFTATDSLAN